MAFRNTKHKQDVTPCAPATGKQEGTQTAETAETGPRGINDNTQVTRNWPKHRMSSHQEGHPAQTTAQLTLGKAKDSHAISSLPGVRQERGLQGTGQLHGPGWGWEPGISKAQAQSPPRKALARTVLSLSIYCLQFV